MMKEILKDATNRMDKTIESLRQELSKVRTGKATTALLDGVKGEYYGTRLRARLAYPERPALGQERPRAGGESHHVGGSRAQSEQ